MCLRAARATRAAPRARRTGAGAVTGHARRCTRCTAPPSALCRPRRAPLAPVTQRHTAPPPRQRPPAKPGAAPAATPGAARRRARAAPTRSERGAHRAPGVHGFAEKAAPAGRRRPVLRKDFAFGGEVPSTSDYSIYKVGVVWRKPKSQYSSNFRSRCTCSTWSRLTLTRVKQGTLSIFQECIARLNGLGWSTRL